ncbi:hypothetical protein CCAX7_50340 [Capsulimonas corticalis]|uniref:Uncharacterized protein n=1 Tax=Capsulimonas corticalis TaxID=2219043 RepID=A0A402CPQ8_9BACT|nr:DUF202 domain-containing protein [Capsulimonas corticalis]BDI32983.1 hypothetical protein CCAX7_50340 [Capsulimonas corticalis]
MTTPKVTEHLANERTFLAWVRTGIALMGFGVLIVRLRYFELQLASVGAPAHHVSHGRATLLGLLFAVFGLVALMFSAITYAKTRAMIDDGNYRPPSRIVMTFVAVLSLLGLATVAYLLALGD